MIIASICVAYSVRVLCIRAVSTPDCRLVTGTFKDAATGSTRPDPTT